MSNYRLMMKVYVNDILKEGSIVVPDNVGNMNITHLYVNERDYKEVLEYLVSKYKKN